MPGGSHRGCTARSRLTACLPQGPRGGCERGPRCRCRCRPPRRAARSMPLSPAGSKHESPESPPPEPPPPPERQPRASAGEPGSGLREETRLDPIRGPAGPRSPKLAAPARMEEPAPGAIVVRIGIPDLQQTVSARPAPTRTAWLPAPTRPDPHFSWPRPAPHRSRPRPTLRPAPHRCAPRPSPRPPLRHCPANFAVPRRGRPGTGSAGRLPVLLRSRCCCAPPLPTSPLPLSAEPRRDAHGCGGPSPRCAPGPAALRRLSGRGARGWGGGGTGLRGEGAQLRRRLCRGYRAGAAVLRRWGW